jgi:DNA-binding transcriptional LysR family regulator
MKTADPLAGIAAFMAVADRASFSAAADDMKLGRATVGAQVRALEQRLGVRLLQRSTRMVALTEAGAAYREALNGIPGQVLLAEHTAAAFQTEAVGRLRIAAPPDLGPRYLAPIIAEYLAANSAVTIDLVLSTDAVDLIGGGYDLAIRGALAVEETLVTRQIGSSPIIVCAAPAYLDRHGTPAKPQHITNHSCLHFSKLRWGGAWHFQKGEETFRVPIMPRLECNDGPTLLAAALAGGGIVLGPAFVVGPAVRAGTLVAVLTEWQASNIPLHVVYPANRHIAQKVRSFVDMLAQAFSRDPDLSMRATHASA